MTARSYPKLTCNMRFNKLDLNLLVALDILLEERSITRAAEKISLSPSALSNSLARLREYFNDELLLQIGRKMELTPLAETLQEEVRDILLRIDSRIMTRSVFDPHRSERTFRIFVSDYTQMVLAPTIMTLSARAASTACFQFLPQVAQPFRALERGDADLLIVPAEFMSPDHPREFLYDEEFVCMVWRDSALAQGELTIDRYAGAGHAVAQPGDGRMDAFESWLLKRMGISRRVVVSTFSFVTLPMLVIGTELIATVHARVARHLVRTWPLEIRPMPIPFEKMQQSVQWHKFRSDDPELVWLRGLLAKAVIQMDAD
ncbi:LysR family transcriptional regulator [Janthinobacterium sp. HLX7-2]|uniref:LysR family transcriptional regulator n=1 Tax=Janthinobacterium sp. HLX7-2 TaxID=1259331 RepID=UPI003F28677B